MVQHPYLAIRTLLQLASDEEHRFPLGVFIVRENMYVDDILAGGDILENALKTREQTEGLLLSGGFPLSKWASFHEALQPIGHVNDSPRLFAKADGIAALGILWSRFGRARIESVRGDQL